MFPLVFNSMLSGTNEHLAHFLTVPRQGLVLVRCMLRALPKISHSRLQSYN